MKVIRLDTANGEYYTLTEKELHDQFTQEQLLTFENDDETYLFETRFTVRQLNHARKLHNDDEYMEWFEDENGICPDVYDILQYKYILL
jgi:hypothetical protein